MGYCLSDTTEYHLLKYMLETIETWENDHINKNQIRNTLLVQLG